MPLPIQSAHRLTQKLAEIRKRLILAVARPESPSITAHGRAVAVFSAGLRRLSTARAFSNFGEFLRQTVGQLKRKGHQFFGFIAGKANIKHPDRPRRPYPRPWQCPATASFTAGTSPSAGSPS